jgi:hypothetical protein
MSLIRVRTAAITLLFMMLAVVGGCVGIGTPSAFPNPVPVAESDIPPALWERLRERYPELKSFEVEYSDKANLYGVEVPSGSIELYDATGRCVGMII